uniref:LON peptidase N-terminal domain and RING finger protein 2 isoform X2 n=1 Tax=Pristiophorus japonicus TaxID=55135 RepID=UPI00398F0445
MEAPVARTEMLELADEAFRAKNYELAADIYECQLQDLGPEGPLYLRKADALSRCDRFTEAFEAYQKAAELERLRPENLQNLLDCIAANIRCSEVLLSSRSQVHCRLRAGASHPGGRAPAPGSGDSGEDEDTDTPSGPLNCRMCLALLFEPVSLPCGHTFCRGCVEKETVTECRLCKLSITGDAAQAASALASGTHFRLNVVLCNLLEKWFPSDCRARRLQVEAGRLMRSRDYSAALGLYNQALSLVPHDYLMLCHRAELYVTIGKYEEALCDGDVACTLKPLKTKGYFWKAQALVEMGRTEEALKEYLYCIALRPDWKSVKLEAQKILCGMFSPVLENMQDTLSTTMRSQSSCLRPKPTFLSSFSSASVARNCTVAGPSEVLFKINNISAQEPNASCQILKKSKATLGETSVLTEAVPSNLTIGSQKRNLSRETEICQSFKTPRKMAKKDEFVPLTFDNFKASREIPNELVDPFDFECSLCMSLTEDVPIFVCTMGFPTIPCPLHVFEPRYRLMIRRCMETGTKQFGMCIGNELKGFADYGCMLEIRDVKFFPDGRSVVDTIGKCRFKVLRHGQRDGYNTADIEYLEDKKVEGEEYSELVCLSDSIYDQAFTWFNSLKDNMRTQILNHFGPMPEKEPTPQSSQNGPAWCWWLLAVLPLESRAQLAVLSMNSLKDRLIAIRRVLVFVTRRRLRSL